MPAAPRLVTLAFALIAPVAAAAEPACTPEKFTTICRSSERELRIINHTVSPSGRYGVAWQPETTARRDVWDDGSVMAYGDALANFLVRLPDGEPIVKLAGKHFGDRSRYNHIEVSVVWSPDNRQVAILNQSKWETEVSDVYRVFGNGVSNPLNLLEACKRATKAEVVKRHPKGRDPYSLSMQVSSVHNDGTIMAKCSMNVVKGNDYFETGMRVKIVADGNGLKAQLIATHLCGENEERGLCANAPEGD